MSEQAGQDAPSWFGRAVGVHNVRRAVEEVLRQWLPVALVDVARGEGLTDDQIRERVPMPRTWHRLADYLTAEADQLPAVMVASPGVVERRLRAPIPGGAGAGTRRGVDLTWLVHVALVVRGGSYEHTAELVGLYSTATALVVEQQLQRHPLIGAVELPTVEPETYDGAAEEQARSMGVALVTAEVTVHDARSSSPQSVQRAPADPFTLAPSAPRVESVDQPTTMREQ